MYNVKEIPPAERPREKMFLKGASYLTDTELLAIILRTGTKGNPVFALAGEMLNRFGNLANMAIQTPNSIKKIDGIGPEKAALICAVFELGRRVYFSDRIIYDKIIRKPKDAAEIFIPMLRDETKEKLFVVSLNAQNKIIRYENITVGLLNYTLIHPREIFKSAIDSNAASIILLHNHPSGNENPSKDDIKSTIAVRDSGKLLGIELKDHIIVAGEKYTSFIEKHLLE